jgi:4-hydroxybenzoate polyprenyltransferase
MTWRHKVEPWLRFFRLVNLPTVPGDVLVGAAAVAALGGGTVAGWAMVAACAASCMFYLFGLADNDIVGASTDLGRPIPDGEISMRGAKAARAACLLLGIVALAASGATVHSPNSGYGTWLSLAFPSALCLVSAIYIYNRTKHYVMMGLCRGFNVMLGATTALCATGGTNASVTAAAAAALVWTVYISAVTRYSEGEETNPVRKRRTGILIGGIVYLQLAALLAFSIFGRPVNNLLVAGAALLIARRILIVALPKVSSS